MKKQSIQEINESLTSQERYFLRLFRSLNLAGQKNAIDHLFDLTEIPKYTHYKEKAKIYEFHERRE